ncbi:MAG TPA: thiamine pyrophosphate-dependent enzyme, partial [Geminicoccaceae bacterium]|nr:thiamine pyrophosphate-dependent enzyme [Geminicoccaceae bacterium]
RGRYTHQIVDHAALLRPLVKGSFEIEREGAGATVSRAVALATTPPMGPVHLDLAPDVAAAPDRSGEALAVPAQRVLPGIDRGDPLLAELRRRLDRAERPLLLAGFEAARGGAAPAVARLAEGHGVPVLTTYKAKGVLDESHPLALGGAGLSPLADHVLKPLVAAADLVLLAGYDPIEMRPGWLDPFPDPTRVVELTSAPPDHGMHAAGIALQGAVPALLEALAEGLEPRQRWPNGEPAAARARLEALFAPPAAWGPHAIIDALGAVLPEDAIVTVDSGAHRILLSQRWKARRPLSLLQSAGWCTMGAAVPLAIGARLTAPDRPVIAVLGDGGLEMTLGELGSVRDQRLPIVIIVLQDQSLALIELKQRQAGLGKAGVALGRTRYEEIAVAFDGVGVRVRDFGGLQAALTAALEGRAFTLITCEIEADAYVNRI